ncbi:hypothetical protein MKEN_00956900 [Mycena kentingensis (nom. inval.)]|nr:hypothetical protein MKEN_00956900 [Mycena kentingensis (nom. inval.)]
MIHSRISVFDPKRAASHATSRATYKHPKLLSWRRSPRRLKRTATMPLLEDPKTALAMWATVVGLGVLILLFCALPFFALIRQSEDGLLGDTDSDATPTPRNYGSIADGIQEAHYHRTNLDWERLTREEVYDEFQLNFGARPPYVVHPVNRMAVWAAVLTHWPLGGGGS